MNWPTRHVRLNAAQETGVSETRTARDELVAVHVSTEDLYTELEVLSVCVCVCWRVSSARQQPPPLPLSFLPFQKNCIYTQHIRCGGPFTWPSSGRRLNKMKFFL